MTDELLREAARALRQETGDDSGRFTRARVMASLHQSQVRQRTRLAFVLPLAASFAAATAWGTVSGHAPEFARTVVRALGFTTEPAQPAPARLPRVATRPAEKAAPAPVLVPPSQQAIPPEPSAEPVSPPQVKNEVTRSVLPASSRPTPSASARSREQDPAHDLYRTAHRLHFVEQNCTQALEAWAAYLREAPGGRFAPEARYNRALCFVRVGDREQARSALTPFARGQYGSYRQEDARALLDALGR